MYSLLLFCFCCCHQIPWPKKQVGEERACLAYTSIQLLIIEGSQNRILKRAETQRQDRSHGRMLLIGLLAHSFFNLLSYRTQDHLPRDGTIHSGLGPPHQSLIKSVPQADPWPIWWRHFLSQGSSSQVILAWVKLTPFLQQKKKKKIEERDLLNSFVCCRS